jgi:O-antigen/teichoic acid export membrane protein
MLTVPIAFWVMAGACGVAAAGWFLTKPQKMVATWAAAYRDWWSNWAFSRWALASQLLGQTTAYIMPWALAAAWDEAATGVFGACNTLVGLANMFVLGLSNYLSPRAARAYAQGGLSELKQVLGTIIALFVVSLGLFAVASFFLGEWVAVLMYSEKYGEALRGSGTIIGVLALGVVANSISMACGNGLWAMHRPAANFAADVCVMVAVVVGSVLLIPPLGPLGAAAATLLAHVTAASVRGWTLLRVMRDTGRQGGAA